MTDLADLRSGPSDGRENEVLRSFLTSETKEGEEGGEDEPERRMAPDDDFYERPDETAAPEEAHPEPPRMPPDDDFYAAL